MKRSLFQIALVVPDYDEALRFYTGVLGFDLVEDTTLSSTKRWVVVTPDVESGARLLLAKAATPHQESRIGDQTGGRVFLFMHTDDVDRDVNHLRGAGVEIVREVTDEPFGRVAVFADPWGNLWDLIQPTGGE